MQIRRRYLVLVFLLLVVLLTACSQSGTPASPSGDKAADKSAGAGAAPTAAKAEVKPAAPAEAKPATTTDAPQKGGTLRIGVNRDLITMDPHNSSVADLEGHYQLSIFNNLVKFSKSKVVPELAESWDIVNPTTYIFKLRKGVKFHDGTDFNAAAVKANWDRLLAPGSKLAQSADAKAIKSVEVVDDYTVKFTLNGPFSPLLALLADKPGRIISPAAIQKYGDEIGLHPVGTGPFAFVEWVKGDHLTLKRFDGYWEKDSGPYVDGVVYRIIPDDTVKLTELKTGGLDLVDRVVPKDIAGIKSDKNVVYIEGPGLAYSWLQLNTAKPPFDNKALRQALAWSIDREAINKALYFGFGQAAYGPVTPALVDYFDPSFKPYPRDVSKAKAKLAEGGQPNGFKFPLLVMNVPLDIQVAQAIKAQLGEAGIDMEIQILDLSAFMAQVRDHAFIAESGFFSGRYDPHLNMQSMFVTGARMNYAQYSSAGVDALMEKGQVATNVAERKAAYLEAQNLIADDAAFPCLHFDYTNTGMSTKVQGYQLEPDGLMRLQSVWLKK